MRQPDLLALYRRLFSATRALEAADRRRPKDPRRRLRPAAARATSSGGFGAALDAAIAELPRGLRTRFAPAPTGYLHLGHVANAVVVWGVATATRGAVILRIEDHDRQRCRPEYEVALLDDLEALGFVPGEPPIAEFRTGLPSPYRQSDNDRTYATAAEDPRVARPRLRLRLHPLDLRGLGRPKRGRVVGSGLPGRLPRALDSSRTRPASPGGWRSAAETRPGAISCSASSPGRLPRPATCPSAIATATGRTPFAWSSTTSATRSTS